MGGEGLRGESKGPRWAVCRLGEGTRPGHAGAETGPWPPARREDAEDKRSCAACTCSFLCC